MGLFSFFNSGKTKSLNGTEQHSNGSGSGHGDPDVPEKLFIEKDFSKKVDDGEKVVIPPAENNIEILFRFLDRNYESSGYDDALINPDSSHLTNNIDALRNDLERMIRKVKTYYEDYIKRINFHIESRGRNGMVDTVDELKMKKEIAESHIEKLLLIEKDAKNNIGDGQGILISYTRGFKNGLAAISHHDLLKNNF